MTFTFIVDEQLPPGLAKLIREFGWQATHVRDLGLRGARDAAIWELAKSQSAVLITKDEDFAAMCLQSADAPQVVWIRTGNTGNRALHAVFTREWQALLGALETGDRLIEIS
ncbi:MAG: DUF5615 family PIN-like protein [Hyphomicrobiales bacterium]|nr:DUF5615 family PIN-like protein [Hyphomicrobiales bacterium]